jgi:hypothetical protein
MQDLNTPKAGAGASLSRRRFVIFAAAGTAATLPAAALGSGGVVTHQTPAEPPLQLTAQERFDLHFEELKKAAQEMYPRLISWECKISHETDVMAGLLIYAFPETCRYEGDGRYRRATCSATGRYGVLDVKLLDKRKDGERVFLVDDGMDRYELKETRFRTYFSGKVL